MLSFTCLLTTVYVLFCSLDGVRVLSRFDAAVYTARRTEMLEIVEATLFYLVDRPVVHSEVSGLPFMVSFISCVSFALIYYQSSYFSILVLWAYWVVKLICTLLGLKCLLQRMLYNNTPHRDFFCCLRESNQGFIDRSGWIYSPTSSPINVPFPDIQILTA